MSSQDGRCRHSRDASSCRICEYHGDDERAHCEAAAEEFMDNERAPAAGDIARLLERERAAARAQGRAEALREAAQVAHNEWAHHRTGSMAEVACIRINDTIRALSRSGGSNG